MPKLNWTKDAPAESYPQAQICSLLPLRVFFSTLPSVFLWGTNTTSEVKVKASFWIHPWTLQTADFTLLLTRCAHSRLARQAAKFSFIPRFKSLPFFNTSACTLEDLPGMKENMVLATAAIQLAQVGLKEKQQCGESLWSHISLGKITVVIVRTCLS